jgi:membrane protein implicated in regulation of membrane protease activity
MIVAAVSLLLTFWLSFTIFSIMSLCLALLGYVLQTDVPQVDEIALLQA